MNLKNLSPRAKRILLGILAGGGLALVVLMTRRNSTATAPDAAALGATPGYAVPGSTFADNGGQAGALSTDITSALGDVAWGLEQLPDLVGTAVKENLPEQPIQQAPAGPSFEDIASLFTGALGVFSASAQAATPSGQQNGGTSTAAKAETAFVSSQAKGTSAHDAAVKAAEKKPAFTEQRGTDSKGRAGVWHIYPDHKVFVPSTR